LTVTAQESLDIADLAVGGNQATPAHGIAAAKMRIILFASNT
jgi:hypothetical protein